MITKETESGLEISRISKVTSSKATVCEVSSEVTVPPERIDLKRYYSNLAGLSKDCLDIVDHETIYNAVELEDRIRRYSIRNSIFADRPNINVDYDGSLVFEWWFNSKKLTFYISVDSVEFIKVWGIDIDNEMEDGYLSLDNSEILESLWNWLVY